MAREGTLVRVDLSSKAVDFEKIPAEVMEKYPGGKALGYYLMAKEVPPATNPLGRENKLLFVPGALSGHAPGASKVAVLGISPESGIIVDSYAGDRFGPFLKRWGYDAIVIEGRSEEMVYLRVGDEIRVESAAHLRGMGVYSATEHLWMKHGDGAVAAIGPAGENLVRFANIMFDTERAAGRGGLGAVMGSKNLKAVFVEPIPLEKSRLKVEHVEEWNSLRQELYRRLEESSSPALREYGTTNSLRISARRGMSPSYNFSRPYIPDELALKLSGEVVKKYEIPPERFIHGKSCPVKCARYVEIEREGEKFRVKPEYESIAMLGAATGVFDFEKVAYFIHLANDLGEDAIAAGNVIAWLFELIERGEMGAEEVGFDVHGFGDSRAEEKLLIHIAYRRGIGAILAEGVKRASEILGRGAEIAVHVKGIEAPAWDPRGLRTYALSYATADIGASHLRGWPSPRSLPNDGPAKELVKSLIESRDHDALMDTMGLCKFVPYEKEDVERIYRAIYGDELRGDIGWRTENIARIFAVLSGIYPPRDDSIPKRWWEPEEDGSAKGNAAFRDEEDFLEARREFYRLRGWHEDLGVPLPETMKKLGMDEFAEMARRALESTERRCYSC